MAKVVTREELLGMAGWQAPPSDYLTVEQDRIGLFADATEDHQFIHIDPERAAKTPFKGTVAHGFLTLSLLPKLMEESAVQPEDLVMAVNYGLNKVRFLQPVRAGSRVRAHAQIKKVQEKDAGRILVTTEISIEIEGEKKPALIAEVLVLYVTDSKA